MKIFVWQGFCPDYTDGLAFAVAETVEQARELVIAERGGYGPYEWGALSIYEITEPIAFSVSGGG